MAAPYCTSEYFLKKILAAYLRQICLILGPADLFAFGFNVPASLCCPNGRLTFKR